jgi:large subunit ribosomal protein L33
MIERATIQHEPAAASSRQSRGSGPRTRITLACSECDTRNYRTTRRLEQLGQLTLKKYCPTCKRHTVHKETK